MVTILPMQKTSQETQRSLQQFLEPNRKPKVIYTDNSLEFGNSCEELSWNHCTSTPHRSETNGIAYWAVQSEKRDICGIVAIRSGSKMVGGFHGVLLLFAKYLLWWENTIWEAFRNSIWRTSYTVWSNGRISPYFCERPIKSASIWSKSLARKIP